MDSETRSASAPRQSASASTIRLKSRAEVEREIQQRVEEERRRLEGQRLTRERKHFHRPIERPFTAAEVGVRLRVPEMSTILFAELSPPASPTRRFPVLPP